MTYLSDRERERRAGQQLALEMYEQDQDPERFAESLPGGNVEWLPSKYEVVIETTEGGSYVYGTHAFRNHAEDQRRRISRRGYFAEGTVQMVRVREVQS